MLKSAYSEVVISDETTLISSGVRIEGKVTSAGIFRVGGEIQGNIFSQVSVIDGQHGQVNGQINADTITIGCKVSGIVKTKDKMVIEPRGNLKKNLYTKILVAKRGHGWREDDRSLIRRYLVELNYKEGINILSAQN